MDLKAFKIVIYLCLFCFFSCGCEGTFSQKQEFRSINIDKAKWVSVKINLKVGDLFISSRAKQFMNAKFEYLQPTRRPEIEYNEDGEKGILYIQQVPRSSVGEFSDIGEKNKWNILFNDKDKISLNISTDVGESVLNLGALNTRRINIDCGEGNILLNLKGSRADNLLVTIQEGEGHLEIRLPSDIGARVKFEEGSNDTNIEGFFKDGEYVVNKMNSENGVFIEVIISGHKGPIKLTSV